MTRHSASRDILYSPPPGAEADGRGDEEATVPGEEAGDATAPSAADN